MLKRTYAKVHVYINVHVTCPFGIALLHWPSDVGAEEIGVEVTLGVHRKKMHLSQMLMSPEGANVDRQLKMEEEVEVERKKMETKIKFNGWQTWTKRNSMDAFGAVFHEQSLLGLTSWPCPSW
jgi:hypothetical protein